MSHREERERTRERDKKTVVFMLGYSMLNCILLEATVLRISLKSCLLDIAHLREDPIAGSVTETDTHDKHNTTALSH